MYLIEIEIMHIRNSWITPVNKCLRRHVDKVARNWSVIVASLCSCVSSLASEVCNKQ